MGGGHNIHDKSKRRFAVPAQNTFGRGTIGAMAAAIVLVVTLTQIAAGAVYRGDIPS